jgi:hypothetical protein
MLFSNLLNSFNKLENNINKTMSTCKCLDINDTKLNHLYEILANNNIMSQYTDTNLLQQEICECDNLIQLVFSETNSPKLYNAFCHECSTHVETKFHKEGLDTHLVATSLVAKYFGNIFYEKFKDYFDMIYLSQTDFVDLCKIVGLFHDIGKPFARNQFSEKKAKPIYVGHAQLGTRLLDQIKFNKKNSGSFLIEKYKDSIMWAINHHMCSCTHMGPIKHNLPNIGIHMLMDLENNVSDLTQKIVSFAFLSVLSYADHLSRLAEDINSSESNDTLNHSFELFERLINFDHIKNSKISLPNFNGKLIIQNYGLSGSGKSYFANLIKEKFKGDFDIVHVERDKSLYTVYEKIFGPINFTDKSNYKLPSYSEVYSAVYENNKSDVQQQWIQDLCDGLETPQTKDGIIIIIDTVQLLFPSQWNTTIESIKLKSEEAYNTYINTLKIGYYGIPINMFGTVIDNPDNIVSKTGKTSVLPDNSIKGLFWPNVYTEKDKTGSSLDQNIVAYGTGSEVLIFNYIKSYFNVQNKNLSENMASNTNVQHNLVHLLNSLIEEKNTKNVGDVFFHFLNQYLDKSGGHLRFISYRVEIENKDYQLITFTYDDGLQTFNGTTRDYRGEGVIYSKPENKFYYLRASLPVFPEMASVQKDSQILPYLVNSNLWDNLESLSNPIYRKLKSQIQPKEISGLYMVPKYDGSLFNLTFIHKSNIVYPMICSLITHNISMENSKILLTSYYMVSDGLFLIGSKGTVLSKNLVNERIHNSILGSYESIEQFLSIASQYVCNTDLFGSNIDKQIITMHFEAIDAIPTSELTVYYGKAWCPFFGITQYDDDIKEKKFILPLNEYKGDWKCVADIHDCNCNWDNVFNIYTTNYDKLLDGDNIIEPEGYVLHLYGQNLNGSNEWLPIKYKYKIYYTAHKPESKYNLNMALELSSNPKYEFLRQRLAKFREKPSVKQILTDLQSDITNINTQIKMSLTELAVPNFNTDSNTMVKIIVKKDWALYWKHNANLNKLNNNFESLKVALMGHYEQFKNLDIKKTVFPFLMKLYETYSLDKNISQLIDINNDQLIDVLNKYFS